MYYFSKRAFDIIVSLIVLIIMSPILLTILIIVKFESPGPALYVSPRIGRGRKVFRCLKVRTMSDKADKQIEQLLHLNRYDSTFIKLDNDPRITRVGQFLRKTSLDELPQLINVLKGDMSIVGNRPLPPYEAAKITGPFNKRFESEAGLTGLWQIQEKERKMNMTSGERMVLDLYYTHRRSFFYDLAIFAKTPIMMVKQSNS